MKVRWTDTSVRVRITPTELGSLQDGFPVTAELRLSGSGWTVVLDPTGDAFDLTADGPHVTVHLPPGDLTALADPEREGLYRSAAGVRLVIEKDFPCAHPHAAEAAEPESERFAPTEGFLARRHPAQPLTEGRIS